MSNEAKNWLFVAFSHAIFTFCLLAIQLLSLTSVINNCRQYSVAKIFYF